MGFDMSTVDEAGKDIKGCDDPQHGEHYWRRNMGGGGVQAQLLVDLGMAYWPRQSFSVPGKWPEPEDYGLKQNPAWEGDEDDPNDPQFFGEPEKVAQYRADSNNYFKQTYDERPGIAAYKLCHSNDGWWVTAAECKSALKLWEQAGQPDVDRGNGDTIPFLRAGAAHAGFRVW
jgi:hypothetical protein